MRLSARRARRLPLLLLAGAAIPAQPAILRSQDRAIDIERLSRAVVTVKTRTATGTGGGSGFILDASGHVVTAAHVLADAKEVRVALYSGEEFTVETVMEVDVRLDLAILRIAGFKLPVASIGDSDSVKAGDRVLTISSPLGLDHTVADGLVSARRVREGVTLLQVSIPVSPGSSGGPVFNDAGRVVGIVVFGMRGSGAENLNFALPINYLRGKIGVIGGKPSISIASAGIVASRASAQDDSSRTPTRSVNTELGIDFLVLNGVELWSEADDDQRNRYASRVNYQAAAVGEGRVLLQRTQLDRVRRRSWRGLEDMLTDYVHSRLFWGQDVAYEERFTRSPILQGVDASSWSLTIKGGQLLYDGMGGPKKASVPYGLVTDRMVGAIVAALPDSLPESVQIEVADPASAGGTATVIVTFETGRTDSLLVPMAQPGRPCDEGRNAARRWLRVVWRTMSAPGGTNRSPVLAARPHLLVAESTTRCVRLD